MEGTPSTRMRRRIVLCACVSGFALPGCFGIASIWAPESGDMVVENEDERTHEIKVSVRNTEPEQDSEPSEEQEATGELILEERYQLDPGGETHVADVVERAGLYEFTAHLRGGTTATRRMDFYEAQDDVGGGVVHIHIEAADDIVIHKVFDD